MLTRREVLTGTAAASIGAIASAHGVAAAVPDVQGCGVGNLTDGVLARFDKPLGAISLFMKFKETAAELFYKDNEVSGEIELFWKIFDKSWSKTEIEVLSFAKGFGTEAFFAKVEIDAAQFFFKDGSGLGVITDIKFGENGGLEIFVKEENTIFIE